MALCTATKTPSIRREHKHRQTLTHLNDCLENKNNQPKPRDHCAEIHLYFGVPASHIYMEFINIDRAPSVYCVVCTIHTLMKNEIYIRRKFEQMKSTYTRTSICNNNKRKSAYSQTHSYVNTHMYAEKASRFFCPQFFFFTLTSLPHIPSCSVLCIRFSYTQFFFNILSSCTELLHYDLCYTVNISSTRYHFHSEHREQEAGCTFITAFYPSSPRARTTIAAYLFVIIFFVPD